jgi:hypothetical protein
MDSRECDDSGLARSGNSPSLGYTRMMSKIEVKGLATTTDNFRLPTRIDPYISRSLGTATCDVNRTAGHLLLVLPSSLCRCTSPVNRI